MRLAMPIFAATAMMSAASPAAEPGESATETRWERVWADDAGEYSYDPRSVRRRGDVVEMTMRIGASAPHPSGFGEGTTRLEVDCAGQTLAFLSGNAYGEDGRLLAAMSPDPGQVQRDSILAGSAYAPIYLAMCPGSRPLSDSVTVDITPVPPGSPTGSENCSEPTTCGNREREPE